VSTELAPSPARSSRREIGTIAALTIVAAAAVLLLSSLHWLHLDGTRPAPFQPLHADVKGRQEFPAVAGLAVVALLVAVLAMVTGVWARRALGVVLTVAGIWSLSYGVRGLGTPSAGRLRDLLGGSQSAGTVAIRSEIVSVLPVLTAVFAAVLALCGIALAVGAGRWTSGLSARYETPAVARRVDDPWRTLDRGEDPTIEDR
jgi:hypothetical protein